MSLEDLERKARGAVDFPSFLSGLVPGSWYRRGSARGALVYQVLRDACRTWYRIRGPVLP